MAKEIAAAEVRLVRCPNCGQVLLEIANRPLYRCGGCHTTLQAKSRREPNVPSETNETKTTHLQSRDASNDRTVSSIPREESGRICLSDPSIMNGENGRGQQGGERDESQSQLERKEKWVTQTSFSDDTSQSAYGHQYHGKAQDIGGLEEHSQGGEEKIDSAQYGSSELPLYNREKRSPTVQNNGDRCMMSNTQNPLYDPRFGSREQRAKVEEGSDGSSGRLIHPRSSRQKNGVDSSLDLSGELLHRSHCQGPQSFTQSQTNSQQFCNPRLSSLVSNDSDGVQYSERGYAEQYWKSGNHSPLGYCGENRVENWVNSAAFEESFVGMVPQKEQLLSSKVHDFSKNYDYHHLNQIAADVIDRTKSTQLELQFQTNENSLDSLMDRSQSTQSEMQFQRSERKMDLLASEKKMSQFGLRSRRRERSLDMLMEQRKSTQFNSQSQISKGNMDLLANQTKQSRFELQPQPREQKTDYLQDPYVFQPSQHGQQGREMEKERVLGVREITSHLSRNMLSESESSDFYTYSNETLSQSNDVCYDYGEFDHSGNLSGIYETELLKQEQMELLRKLDDLRDQLSRSCQLSSTPMMRGHQKIGRSVVASEVRPVAVEKQLCQMGHGGGFPAADSAGEVLSLGESSVGSKANSGQLTHDAWTQCIPQEEWRCLHLKPEFDMIPKHSHGAMDGEDMELSNELASKSMCAQKLETYKSDLKPYELYVSKRTIPTSRRVSHVPFSREQEIKDRHQFDYAPYQSVQMNQHSCNCCSRHSLQQLSACCSRLYCEHQQPLHVPLQVQPTDCLHQQLCTAASNQTCSHHFCPTHVGVQASLGHCIHRNSYHEAPRGQRSVTQDSGLILCQENKHSQFPVTSKRRIFRCLPFAGGAPFILCDNCLQLLIIPANLPPSRKKNHKLRCGRCLKIFVFTVHDKRNSITMTKFLDYPSRYMQTNPRDCADLGFSAARSSNTVQVVDSNEMSARGIPHSRVDDYNFLMSESHSADDKPGIGQISLSIQHSGLKSCVELNKPNLPHRGLQSYSVPSKHHLLMAREVERPQACADQSMRSFEGLELLRHDSNSIEGLVEASLVPPLAGSPLHEHFGYSSPSQMINKFLPEKTSVANPRKSSGSRKPNHSEKSLDWEHVRARRKLALVASPPCEYSSLDTSTEFTENEHDDELSKDAGRSWNTSFAGFLKKSIRDLKKGNQGSEARPKVSVNGRFIPDPLIKKAEVYAGRIRPGHYWYDCRAGFWGVMGEPCLGIIPPSIEEFNYPMPRDCAGGKTRILVNGRELHQEDLELLAARGLPTTKDKAYIIEISGRIVDEASGTELKSLGKLAPTLERIGRGSGMFVPKKGS